MTKGRVNGVVLNIKNMVCLRCINTVRRLAEEAGAIVDHVQLGEVEISAKLNDSQKKIIADRLQSEGFELMDDKTGRIVLADLCIK